MCGEHRRLMSPEAAARIKHCRAADRDSVTDLDKAQARAALRISLALGFAHVCVKVGIDPQTLGKQKGQGMELTKVAQSITEVLRGV
jgi:hypothetical protein